VTRDARRDAAHVRDVFLAACPLLEAALTAGLPRGADLAGENATARLARKAGREATALAARIYKRGGTSSTAFSPSLVAPCVVEAEETLLERLRGCEVSESANELCVVDAGFAEAHPRYGAECARNKGALLLADAEGAKTLEGIAELLGRAAALPLPFDRVLAVGGGATTDLAGFAAGLLGVPFEVVPTTFLAVVDAAQGGKTGVNAPPWGKNQIGLFHGAKAFRLVPPLLATLPLAERASGFGEALKHCYLLGRWPLSARDASLSALTMEPDFLLWNMRAKGEVVAVDPREAHARKLLNLGHTLGHAWEGMAHERLLTHLPHGVCVALGIHLLARAGWLVGAPAAFLDAIEELVARFTPRALGSDFDLKAAFKRLVAADKKNVSAEAVTFVIPPWGVLAKGAADLDSVEAMTPFLRVCAVEEAWEVFRPALALGHRS
jgi:3-dehydroquinate synthase